MVGLGVGVAEGVGGTEGAVATSLVGAWLGAAAGSVVAELPEHDAKAVTRTSRK